MRHEAGHSAAKRNREAPLSPVELASATEAQEETLHRKQLVRLLLEAVDHLPPTYRDVVHLRDLEGRAVADVALQLHISQSNVAVRLHRAHKRLRRYLMRQLHLPGEERAPETRAAQDSPKPR